METLLLKRIFEELLLTRRTPSYIAAYYTNRHLSINDSNKSVESALARFECSTLSDHEGSKTVALRDNHICEMCDTPLRWSYCAAKGFRRAFSES